MRISFIFCLNVTTEIQILNGLNKPWTNIEFTIHSKSIEVEVESEFDSIF